MKSVSRILPHINIILSGMFIVFYVIDRMNSAMDFINNDITKTLLLLFSIVSITVASLFIASQRRLDNEPSKRP